MIIRKAEPGDAGAIAETLRRSIVELCRDDYGTDEKLLARWLHNKRPDVAAGWIADAANHVIVAVDDGAMLGVASMTEAGEITLNYVSPEARFRGVSTALLSALESEARSRGLARCTLQTTRTAFRFYRARGYRPADEAAEPARGAVMTRDLA